MITDAAQHHLLELRYDLVAVTVRLAGAAVIMYAPRPAALDAWEI